MIYTNYRLGWHKKQLKKPYFHSGPFVKEFARYGIQRAQRKIKTFQSQNLLLRIFFNSWKNWSLILCLKVFKLRRRPRRSPIFLLWPERLSFWYEYRVEKLLILTGKIIRHNIQVIFGWKTWKVLRYPYLNRKPIYCFEFFLDLYLTCLLVLNGTWYINSEQPAIVSSFFLKIGMPSITCIIKKTLNHCIRQ